MAAHEDPHPAHANPASRMFRDDDRTPPELYEREHWYACRTRARAEKKVEKRLDAAGIEAFLPLVDREREWADRTKTVAMPLFPGFVFARFDLTRIYPVISTHGVATVLSPNGYPTPVRDEEIASLRRLVDGANATGTPPAPADYLEPGQEVVVTSGPFEGMRGVLIERRGGARVAVRISALRQATSVDVGRELLRPLRAGEESSAA